MSDILIQFGIADFIAFSDNLHNLFDFSVGICNMEGIGTSLIVLEEMHCCSAGRA